MTMEHTGKETPNYPENEITVGILQIRYTGEHTPETLEEARVVNQILLAAADSEHIVRQRIFANDIESEHIARQRILADDTEKALPAKEDNALPKYYEDTINDIKRITLIRDEISNLKKDMQEIEADDSSSEGATDKTDYASPITRESTVININSRAELLFVTQVCDLFHHDLGNPLTSASGRYQLAVLYGKRGRDVSSIIEKGDQALVSALQTINETKALIKNRYPVDILNWDKEKDLHNNVSEVFNKNLAATLLAKDIPITTRIYFPESVQERHPVWSYVWFSMLLKNMAQNADRAYRARDEMWDKDESKKDWPKEKDRVVFVNAEVVNKTQVPDIKQKIDPRYQLDPSKSYMAFSIEDRAIGFQDNAKGHNIARDGYDRGSGGYGQTEVSKESTATAMAIISDASFKNYGVVIVPENVFDHEGNLLGARQTIYVPLIEES